MNQQPAREFNPYLEEKQNCNARLRERIKEALISWRLERAEAQRNFPEARTAYQADWMDRLGAALEAALKDKAGLDEDE